MCTLKIERLDVGKIDPRTLKERVFTKLGAPRGEVVFGPCIGGDAAALKIESPIIVVKSDPIVGASKRIGRLVVNVVSNDIACLGAETIAITLTILLPEDSKVRDLERIVSEVHSEALKRNIAIVGGHTEVAVGLKGRPPILVASGVGVPVSSRIIPSNGAKPGDSILMTKYAGVEGTSIIAEDFEDKLRTIVELEVIEKAKKFIELTSVVEEALALAREGIPNAMHDPTDGGLLEGLYEMAEAAGLGFKVWEEKIRVAYETSVLCKVLEIDPLKLISSGTLLVALPKSKVRRAIEVLREINVPAQVIGEFTNDREEKILVRRDMSKQEIREPLVDELWKLYQQY